MLETIALTVRSLFETLWPSDLEQPIKTPAEDERTKIQQVEEPGREEITQAILDSGEDVLDPSRVRLFGVPFVSLRLVPEEVRKYRYSNKLLQQKIVQADARLARIYGFSYEGQYFKLPKPFVFMVHGPGKGRLENRPASVSNWGVENKDFQFADDVRVWEMDDLTLRVDVTSGFVSEILLDPALSGSPEMAARQHLVARQHLIERPELAGNQRLAGRVEMAARHRAMG